MVPLTTADFTSEAGHHGVRPAAERAGNTRVFRRARRHSRHVRLLRIGIPMALALLVAGVAASTWLDPARLLSRLPIQSAGTVISGTKIIMAQPKLSGYTKDSRWYELVAIAAAQDITKPDLVELQQVNARLEMQDKSTMNLSALDGVFDRKAAILTLGRDILLRSTAGFEIRLEHAVVDTANGHIVSDKPVEVRMQQGTLNANRLEVSNSGEVIRFEGGVTMNLQPAAGDRAAAVRTP